MKRIAKVSHVGIELNRCCTLSLFEWMKSTRTDEEEDVVAAAVAEAAAACCQCGSERADSAAGGYPAAFERCALCFPTGPRRIATRERSPPWTAYLVSPHRSWSRWANKNSCVDRSVPDWRLLDLNNTFGSDYNSRRSAHLIPNIIVINIL